MRHKAMLAAALALSLPGAAFLTEAPRAKPTEEPPQPRREPIRKPHQGAKEMARRRRQMARSIGEQGPQEDKT